VSGTAIGIGREALPAARTVSAVGEDVRVHADRATRIWIFSSIFWLGFVDLIGLVMALELVEPNLFGGIPWLLFSRIRPIHVNGVIFAWLSAMYFGGIFYMLPRLLGLADGGQTRAWPKYMSSQIASSVAYSSTISAPW
jgi:cbb3-type cytochrome oxidase subunit 1